MMMVAVVKEWMVELDVRMSVAGNSFISVVASSVVGDVVGNSVVGNYVVTRGKMMLGGQEIMSKKYVTSARCTQPPLSMTNSKPTSGRSALIIITLVTHTMTRDSQELSWGSDWNSSFPNVSRPRSSVVPARMLMDWTPICHCMQSTSILLIPWKVGVVLLNSATNCSIPLSGTCNVTSWSAHVFPSNPVSMGMLLSNSALLADGSLQTILMDSFVAVGWTQRAAKLDPFTSWALVGIMNRLGITAREDTRGWVRGREKKGNAIRLAYLVRTPGSLEGAAEMQTEPCVRYSWWTLVTLNCFSASLGCNLDFARDRAILEDVIFTWHYLMKRESMIFEVYDWQRKDVIIFTRGRGVHLQLMMAWILHVHANNSCAVKCGVDVWILFDIIDMLMRWWHGCIFFAPPCIWKRQ